MEIGERIRKVREAEHLGRDAFSKKTGINKKTLANIETGERKNFSVIELERVAINFPDYAMYLVTGKTNEEIEKRLANSFCYRK